ncbi:unnamed protein product, partial [Staurois parvus]
CKRSQAGRVNNNRAGRYRGSGREWSGSQARDQTGEVSRGPDQAGSAMNQSDWNRNRDAGNKIQGPRKNTHQGPDCRSGHPLNTPA